MDRPNLPNSPKTEKVHERLFYDPNINWINKLKVQGLLGKTLYYLILFFFGWVIRFTSLFRKSLI